MKKSIQLSPTNTSASMDFVTYATGFKVKFSLLVLYVIAVVFLHRYFQFNDLLNLQTVKELFYNNQSFSPVLFIVAYACGICLFFPAILLTAVGAILFGTVFGFFYTMAGAMLGSSIAFFIGRYLGRHLFSSILSSRLSISEKKLAKHGFATTLCLRLACFPFTPLSFGMGLTQVTFLQYFFGTFFGKFISGFIITFFFATLKEAVISGQMYLLFEWKILLACMLFIGSFYIPKMLYIFKQNCSSAAKRKTKSFHISMWRNT